MVLLDEKKELLKDFYIVDLKDESDEEDADEEDTAGLTIRRGLPPGAYDLDHTKYYF
jgi:hypothetical protein